MRLDLNLLEVFCCIAQEGSFSKAAEKLLISQPTVSGHIKNLEDYVSARLFDRLPRRVELTRAGMILYAHGRVILDEKRAAIHDLQRYLNRIEGSLDLCASTIPGEYLLPQIVAGFHTRFPAIRVEVRIQDSKAVCEAVLEGRCEIGFVGAKLAAVALEFRHCASDHLVLAVPNNAQWRDVDSITLDELATMPFLARELGSGTQLTFEQKVGRSIESFNVVARVGSTSAVKEGLKAGLGVSVLSDLALPFEIKAGVLKTVNITGVAPIRREFYTVTNRSRTMSPIAEAFLGNNFEALSKEGTAA